VLKQQGKLDAGAGFLPKPFTHKHLHRKLRELLDHAWLQP
jgi:hypothetical protein